MLLPDTTAPAVVTAAPTDFAGSGRTDVGLSSPSYDLGFGAAVETYTITTPESTLIGVVQTTQLEALRSLSR